MIMRHLLVAASLLACSVASAGDLSKEQCIDAHSRGQDAKEAGKLSLARKLFLTCAQPSCPSIVQGDCARFADDLTRLQPSISFAARDGNGNDLPDTTVYVDDALIVTRIDGAPHDVDPGKHTVKFQNGGKEQTVTVVVGAGEKGRTVVGTFGSPTPVSTPAAGATTAVAPIEVHKPAAPHKVHPGGSRALIGVGAALAVGGAVLGVYGVTKIPSVCSLGNHQCSAPPGDPVFDQAKSGARFMDIGFVMAGVGVAALVGGIGWYVTGAKTEKPDEGVAVAPWLSPSGGGISFSGHL